MRADLYENTGENIIIEDFVLSLKICMKGFIIKYEPLSFATEDASFSMKEEEKKKSEDFRGRISGNADP